MSEVSDEDIDACISSISIGYLILTRNVLQNTSVRVTAIYPGNIRDISPLDAEWTQSRGADDSLSNREVVDAIVFMLNLPASVTVKELVIE